MFIENNVSAKHAQRCFSNVDESLITATERGITPRKLSMRTQQSITIERPIEEVFDYTIHQSRQWSQSIVSDQVIEEKNGGGVGTRFRMVTEENGREMIFQGEVTRWNRPHVARSFLKGDQFDIDVEYRFENLGYRTVVTQESKVLPKSIGLKVVFLTAGWLLKGFGKRALRKDLQTLKQQLEAASRP